MKTYFEKITTWDKIMMAITFAEAGEAGTACDFLNNKRSEARVGQRTAQRPEIRF
ncbi:MAG: hypothetical protein KKD73_11135 [Proteobacteria bacterium]|nr:hypothetical protein [Pseudomonadota bacterium]MBU1641234.1 hypothetical protein [Pseudomonadota bacterium]